MYEDGFIETETLSRCSRDLLWTEAPILTPGPWKHVHPHQQHLSVSVRLTAQAQVGGAAWLLEGKRQRQR